MMCDPESIQTLLDMWQKRAGDIQKRSMQHLDAGLPQTSLIALEKAKILQECWSELRMVTAGDEVKQ